MAAPGNAANEKNFICALKGSRITPIVAHEKGFVIPAWRKRFSARTFSVPPGGHDTLPGMRGQHSELASISG
jgi:hypothetical protein